MRKFYILSVLALLVIPIFSLNAQSVDLLWQGNTYTPPFYEGAPIWSSQSMITILAVTNGLGDPAKLVYKWTQNGTVLGNINGFGRSSISFYDTIISRPQTIKVDILPFDDYDSAVLASATVFVAATSPTLAIYENNPLYGFMFHRETSGTHQLEDREVTFTAFPLFFTALNRFDSTLGYEWQTNVGIVETRNSVTYSTPDDATGVSSVQVRALSRDKILQSGDNSFLVEFGSR